MTMPKLLSPNTSLSHYRIINQLGAGGMGEVYLAEDTRLERKVALKLLPAEFTKDPERVRRFEQEARAASALNHPNIITIYDIGQADGVHFIATEFIEGQTLRQRLASGRMMVGEALTAALQVAEALQAAHAAGIIHRDIKPENLMLRPDGYVKVLDFGLAKLTEPAAPTCDTEAPTAAGVSTEPGVVMGTVRYMSPEQMRGQKVDARTDLFSFGVVLYEMIAGRAPFAGATTADVIAALLDKEPPPLARYAPEVPVELECILSRALRKDRERRYQTVSDLLVDLKGLKQEREFAARQEHLAAFGTRAADVPARPETRYARSGDVHIAYQVIGNGPLDLVYVRGWVSNLDYFWEEPSYARFLHRLTSFSRLILFDKRGTGLSDRVHESELPTLEQRMDDVRAVMDAVGSARAALFGVSEGGPMCALFAATYPERTAALVMYGSYAKRIWSPDYPWAPTPGERQKFFDLIQQGWGGVVDIEVMAPSRATDERFREWWAAYLRRSASPGAALAFAKMNTQIDIRHLLPTIRVPALILHRTGDLDAHVRGSRYMAERIPGAKYVELPGNDHLPWAGDQAAILDQVAEFLTGIQQIAELDRVLATVLSTNIVGPAAQAATPGPNQWRAILARFRGREIETTEESLLATFDGPARAIRAACAVGEAAQQLGLKCKIGLHTGECDVIGDRLGGVAVEISRQVAAQAAPGEVLVSSTVKDLVAGSGIGFADRGVRLLTAGAGEWHLFAVEREESLRREMETRPGWQAAAASPEAGAAAASRRSRAETDVEPGKKTRAKKTSPASARGHFRKTIQSLAVLPLVNASEDPGAEYLSDGITESIINNLAQLAKLRVMARSTVFRYKGRAVDPQQVGQELGVGAVLSGRVQQLGDTLVIGTELVNAEDGAQLWGGQFRRELSDIFAVQEEIAREISEKLRLRLTGEQKRRLTKRHTENAEAYQLYLKGRYYWNQRTEDDLRKGIECFQQAIKVDPRYALAYTGLADCYAFLGDVGITAIPPREAFSQALAAVMKALQLDDTLAEAHTSLAHLRMHHYEWTEAEREFQRALELNPSYATTYHWYAFYFAARQRYEEALTTIAQARALEPLSLAISTDVGVLHYYAGHYDEAIKLYLTTLELDPSFVRVYVTLASAYSKQGRHGAALEMIQKAITLSGGAAKLAALGRAYAAAGRRDEALGIVSQLQEQAQQHYVSPYSMALIYAALGEGDAAFNFLEEAYQEGAGDLIFLNADPWLDQLRADARFADLLQRVGLAS
jgi:TolB-like protein/pimeloyl-ACP methyl ester carboxylesterase/Tfp pilus assembly protein PilF/predicted Ser/Thr protein kinase